MITIARVALQNVWKAKQFDWDDPGPDDMSETWKKLFEEVASLKNVQFPRCLQPKEVSGVSELHVFADVSKTAYGAVAYLVWMTPHGPHVSLVSAKARVALYDHSEARANGRTCCIEACACAHHLREV